MKRSRSALDWKNKKISWPFTRVCQPLGGSKAGLLFTTAARPNRALQWDFSHVWYNPPLVTLVSKANLLKCQHQIFQQWYTKYLKTDRVHIYRYWYELVCQNQKEETHKDHYCSHLFSTLFLVLIWHNLQDVHSVSLKQECNTGRAEPSFAPEVQRWPTTKHSPTKMCVTFSWFEFRGEQNKKNETKNNSKKNKLVYGFRTHTHGEQLTESRQ